MNVKIDIRNFQVRPRGFSIDQAPTQIGKVYKSASHYRELLAEYIDELRPLQSRLYAHDRHAVLIVFQAMDAAGKDGAIKHVMSGINPQGCQVYSFKQPSDEELSHDFLWRLNRRLPERGRIGIFNRSHYEEVLIVRVHPEILQKQHLPESALKRRSFWKDRYRDIVRWEDYLVRNGTKVIKFFLHMSREEQKKRFLKRIDDPEKNWKLSPADLEVRQFWDAYMEAYEACLIHTTHQAAPWHIVPADDKRNARLIVSQVILENIRSLEIGYPESTEEHRRNLAAVRRSLENEKGAGNDRQGA